MTHFHQILKVIQSPNDTLKEIKERLTSDIAYNEIHIVLAQLKFTQKKKTISYHIEWYKKVHCLRKYYFNKQQRDCCRIKMQQLVANKLTMEFTQQEFLQFFNTHITICQLPQKEKIQFVSYKEFCKMKRK